MSERIWIEDWSDMSGPERSVWLLKGAVTVQNKSDATATFAAPRRSPTGGRVILRKEFDNLAHTQRADFIRTGGQVVDE